MTKHERTMNRTMRGVSWALGLLLPLGIATVARAANINVNTNSMVTNATDGKCTLVEAVKALNTQVASGSVAGECPAGNGSADKITLMSSTQVYTTNETLAIYRHVEIAGAGESRSRLSTTALYGITVDDRLHMGASVWIHGLTIQNARSDGWPVFCVGVSGSDAASAPRLDMDDVTINKCTTGLVANGPGNVQFHGRQVTVANSKSSGIRAESAKVYLYNSLIIKNAGSGIYSDGTNSGSHLELDHTTVDGNTAENGGGIHVIGNIGGYLTIRNSTISNNTATGDGGGIYDLGHPDIHNSTISGNRATRGGGLFHDSFGECYVYSSTIAFNTATSSAGGVYSAGGTNAVMISTILANNNAPTGPDCTGVLNSGLVPVAGSDSLLGSSADCPTKGNGFIYKDVDAKLGPLLATGMPFGTKVHPPLKGSPAINQLAPGEPGALDQRGMWQPDPVVLANGSIQPGTQRDIGAYEYNIVWPHSTLPIPASSGDALGSTGPLLTFAANATNDYITFSPLIAESGTYTITAQVQKWKQGGIYQLQAAESLAGPYTNLTSQDLYASSTSTPALAFGSVSFSGPGLKYLRFRVTGKHNSATGYKLYLGYIKLVKAS